MLINYFKYIRIQLRKKGIKYGLVDEIRNNHCLRNTVIMGKMQPYNIYSLFKGFVI
jgi:hypothetical protein